jgi:GxxExxY protein
MDRVTRLPDSIRDPQTYAIIGAAMEVHTVLGPGLLESVYRDSLRVEFAPRRIQHACEVEFPAYYKGSKLESRFRPDFVCNEFIILEIKAIPAFGRTEEQQLVNYLKVSRLPRGLLINFGSEHLQFKRFVLSGDPRLRRSPLSVRC